MASLHALTHARPLHWIALSLAILVLDYFTGPSIQFPILFVFPVALATAGQGLAVGISVATALPILRLGFFLQWPLLTTWPLQSLDSAVDVVILVGIAFVIDRIMRQEHQIRALEGLLPICSFCKKIRDDSGVWRQLETYIGSRSSARFSHTFCPDCGRRHYPELVD
jgi:hypothetical protein